MKAPDKIYLNRPNPEEGGDFFPYWTVNAEKADNVISEAYIRKETLLEWAKQKQYDSTTIVQDDFWQEVIDKLNAM